MIGSLILTIQIITGFICAFIYPDSITLLLASVGWIVIIFIYSVLHGMPRKLADAYAAVFAISGIFTGIYGKDVNITILFFLTSVFLILFPYPKETRKSASRRKKKRKNVPEDNDAYVNINPHNLTPEEFKQLILKLLEKMDYRIEREFNFQENGFDTIITDSESRKLILMARRYKGLISTKLLQKLFEKMLEENADGGIFITTSDFSYSSYRLSESKPIKLVNGKELNELLQDFLNIILEI
ncbi:MAG: restriction endonuclease [Thermotogaceae bacterium]|nr:restriction endonuclease [Thermotogaceae bacterium]